MFKKISDYFHAKAKHAEDQTFFNMIEDFGWIEGSAKFYANDWRGASLRTQAVKAAWFKFHRLYCFFA